MPCSIRSVAFVLTVLIPFSACAPAYQPREVLVPANCEVLARRAAEQGVNSLSEGEQQQLDFCQQQQLLRAEEEQAAYAKYQVRSNQSSLIASLIYATVSLLIILNEGRY